MISNDEAIGIAIITLREEITALDLRLSKYIDDLTEVKNRLQRLENKMNQ